MRYAWVVIGLFFALLGCNHQPPDYVSKYTPPPPPPLTAAVSVIGDAYTSGSRMGGYASHGWPALAGAQLQKQGIDVDLKVGAEDGSGYVAAGREHGLTFADQIPEVVGPDTRLVVLFGSANDMAVPAATLAPAVQKTLAKVKATAKSAGLLVIGPAWVDANPPRNLLTTRDVVKAGAEGAGAVFVDPIAEKWFTGQPGLIGSDHSTPTNAGHEYLAGKIAPLIAQQLQPLPAGTVVPPAGG